MISAWRPVEEILSSRLAAMLVEMSVMISLVVKDGLTVFVLVSKGNELDMVKKILLEGRQTHQSVFDV